ncbi:MAG: CPBP family intramembrane glutamic endopeptidase [Phycisphaerales bacterium]
MPETAGSPPTQSDGSGQGRIADPGTPKAARLAWVILLIALPVVVIFQQLSAHATPDTEPDQIAAPTGDNVEVSTRLGARASFALGQGGASFQQEVDDAATTPLQRFRAAISAGEIIGPEEAADRLDGIIDDLRLAADEFYPADDANAQARRGQLIEDAELLRPVYAELAESEDARAAELLDAEALEGLKTRHGFFGELVAIAGLSKNDAKRVELLDGALVPLVFLGLFIGVVGLAVLLGVALGITALVLVGMGSVKFTMPRPAPGGSVYLESAVLFVVCFALLQIVQGLAALLGETALMIAGMLALPAQWLLLLVPLWPLLRGTGWQRLRDDLGLRAGKGVLVEIVAGVAGYLALLPLVLAGMALMFVLLAVQQQLFPGDGDAMAPTNPILELVRTLDPVLLIMLFTLATIWAPLCEELVFRGALFRHMRARLALPVAAVLSAMVFGLMHGYAALQLIPVTILGFNFAMIRAWRGSLIGPIVAHALNNAVVLGLLFALAFVLYG